MGWVFSDMNYFKFMKLKKRRKVKIGLSAIDKIYVVSALHNARASSFGTLT